MPKRRKEVSGRKDAGRKKMYYYIRLTEQLGLLGAQHPYILFRCAGHCRHRCYFYCSLVNYGIKTVQDLKAVAHSKKDFRETFEAEGVPATIICDKLYNNQLKAILNQ
eukprot:scaffold52635_cov46-Attheya_sp.AAC.2